MFTLTRFKKVVSEHWGCRLKTVSKVSLPVD